MTSGIENAIERAGSVAALAEIAGVTVGAVYLWRRAGYVSPANTPTIAKATGVQLLTLENMAKPRGLILKALLPDKWAAIGQLATTIKSPVTTTAMQVQLLVKQGVMVKRQDSNGGRAAQFSYSLSPEFQPQAKGKARGKTSE